MKQCPTQVNSELYNIYQQHPIVTTDSRNCPEGSLFFALKGETFDGNAFAVQALGKGCAYAIVDNPDVAALDERLILVPDVLTALQELAAHHRRVWGGPVLQITGTNGKTTTKELIAAVLSEGKRVLYTEGNLNNHIGVPLTLLRIRPEEHDIAVIETGANHPGEISNLCRIVQADWGLITNVGRAHLEGFGSFNGVRQAKGELYDDLHHRGKQIFLNAFDDVLLRMAQERGFILKQDALPYVEGRVSAVAPFVEIQWQADDSDYLPLNGGGGGWRTVRTNLIGAYNISNLRAAVTIGLYFGITPEQIDHALTTYKPTNSRSELRQVGTNRLIVDAYNANPSSMSAALTNFSFFEDAHKVVILGDMRELGAESLEEHKRILSQLQTMELERIWLVGEEFEKAVSLCSEASDAGLPSQNHCTPRVFKDVQAVKEALKAAPITNSTILIKGSNSTKLHQLPEVIVN